MRVDQIRDGLWRWTVPHPRWAESPSREEWPPEVGCVYYEAPDATVLIDPLAPPAGSDDAARFWRALDRDVERRGLPVCVLRTIAWHERSAAEVRARYGDGPTHSAAVEAIPLGDPYGEHALLIAEHRALAVGDLIVGADALGGPAGEVRACPLSWFDADDAAQRDWYATGLLDALAMLAGRDVELVLTSHGTPAWSEGQAALRRARDVAAGG